jgi:anti-sigma factor RsiW
MSESSEEMVCDELVELVTTYIEGKLPDSDRSRLEQHLTECSWCVDYVAQHREILSALHRLDDDSPASAGEEEPAFSELLAILRERRSDRSA